MWHELRHLLPLAGPIIASQVGQIGMNVVDTVMVGPLGAQAIAAVGLGGAIYTVLYVLCSGIVISVAALVSQAFGANDEERCRRLLMQGLWLAILGSLPVIVGCLCGGQIAVALGQDAAVAALTGRFLRALSWGVLPGFLFTCFRQFLEGRNQAKIPMAVTFIGLAVNIVANRTFIYGWPGWIVPMGAVGPGWATTIVRWAMCLVTLGAVIWAKGGHPFRRQHVRPDRRLLAELVRLGIPIGVQAGLEVGLFSLAAVMMGWMGPLPLAAHQVTISIASTTFMVAMGISMAGAIRVGQHYGAGQRVSMRQAAIATYVMALGFMSLCALTFAVVPERLVRLYTPDADVISLASRLLLVAAVFQLFDGAQVAAVGILRGAAETKASMRAGAFGYWCVGMPVGYGLAFHTPLGPVGVWVGLCIGLAVVAVLLGARVRNLMQESPI